MSRLLWVMTEVLAQRVLGGGSGMAPLLHLLLLHRLLALVPLATAPLLLPLREGPWPQGREAEGGDNALSPNSNDRAEGTVWSIDPERIGQRWLVVTARLEKSPFSIIYLKKGGYSKKHPGQLTAGLAT